MEREVPKITLPANCLIVGETCSGKSTILRKMLQHRHALFAPAAPDKALLLYSRYQQEYKEWQRLFPGLEMVEGLQPQAIDEFVQRNRDSSPNGLALFVDDLMTEMVDSAAMANVFVSGRHLGFR